ncbi:MAG TPA: hypothetical protein VIS94_03265, partial [Desulfomonilia bacterium]
NPGFSLLQYPDYLLLSKSPSPHGTILLLPFYQIILASNMAYFSGGRSLSQPGINLLFILNNDADRIGVFDVVCISCADCERVDAIAGQPQTVVGDVHDIMTIEI